MSSNYQPNGFPIRPSDNAPDDAWRQYADELEAIIGASEHRAEFLQTRLNKLSTHPAWKLLKKARGLLEGAPRPNAGNENEALALRYAEFKTSQTLTSAECLELKQRLDALPLKHRPMVSLLTTIQAGDDTKPLEQLIASLQSQLYSHWELCIAVESGVTVTSSGLENEGTDRIALQSPHFRDDRVHECNAEGNAGRLLQAALKLASGEYAACVNLSDTLYPDALARVVLCLSEGPADILYSDHEFFDRGKLLPCFKPAWSPDLFLSNPFYLGQICVLRTACINRDGFNSAELNLPEIALISQVTTHAKASHIKHIPRVLCSIGNTSVDNRKKDAKEILKKSLALREIDASIEAGLVPHTYRVKRSILKEALVSILIPFRDDSRMLKRCFDSIRNLTAYKNYEFILVDNGSIEKSMQRLLASEKSSVEVKIIRVDEPFNYSRLINTAARQAQGEHLLLLNNDMEALDAGWLSAMLEHSQRDEVGAVGAKLLYPNGRIQHAGVAMGLDDLAAHVYRCAPDDCSGLDYSRQLIRNCSAVTGACLMTRRKLFSELGGLNELELPVAYSDIDYCLRIREKGLLVVYTPYACLRHHESVSRGTANDPRKAAYMCRRWAKAMDDPYFSANQKVMLG